MKSYKKSLCAIILVTFLTIGLGGCCSTMSSGGGGGWLGSEPEYQGPRTMKEFLDQEKPGKNFRFS